MKHVLMTAGLMMSLLLAGCQFVPEMAGADAKTPTDQCLADVPGLEGKPCMLDAWVDFGLASQRADDDWRKRILEQTDGDDTNARLARAVVYAWADRSRWHEASELFKAELASAPSELQPLLRQWLNGLEARRKLLSQYHTSEAARLKVEKERDELAEKLDALTAIEESINSRNQAP